MGNSSCNPTPGVANDLFAVAHNGGIVPDISLDGTLRNFLSLNSSEALDRQYEASQRALPPGGLAPYNRDLAAAFGPGAQVPYGGVGVVALALSLLLEVLAQENTADPIRRIFGADHSSDIGTLASEYLKQVPRLANDSRKMASVTERYDHALTYELMDLFEAMTLDRRISSTTMKQWLNGAAFHLHLRIHRVRTGALKQGSAESLAVFYRMCIPGLFNVYADYLQRHVQATSPGFHPGLLIMEPSRNVSHRVKHRACESPVITNTLVRKVVEAQGLQRTLDFFEGTEKHMESLVNQRGNFSLRAEVQ